MTIREAEKAVVIARRRAKRAPDGRKTEAAVHLKDAVTLALSLSAPSPRAVKMGSYVNRSDRPCEVFE